jgi:IS30 family transposase
MNYKQLTEKNKVEIDILLKQGLSMRKVASILGISHSTISNCCNGKGNTAGGFHWKFVEK